MNVATLAEILQTFAREHSGLAAVVIRDNGRRVGIRRDDITVAKDSTADVLIIDVDFLIDGIEED